MHTLVLDIQNSLEHVKDPNRVGQMEAYMKNNFSFIGVMSGPRKEIFRIYKPQILQLNAADFWDFVYECWANPYREIQYIAVDALLAFYKKMAQPSDAQHLTFILSNQTWWDSLDLIASYCVGIYAQKFPDEFKELALEWQEGPNFWLHRTLIIHQLKFKQKTNLELLQYYIHCFKGNKEFFVQKAIGWSLREVSKWNPDWVKTTVVAEQLIGLAKREALKYVP